MIVRVVQKQTKKDFINNFEKNIQNKYLGHFVAFLILISNNKIFKIIDTSITIKKDIGAKYE